VKKVAPKAAARKAAPAKPVPQKKPVPAKAAPPKKPAAAKAAPQKMPAPTKPAPAIRSKAPPVGNSVTTSKPQAAAAKGGKSTRMPPPIEAGVTMQDGRFALPPTVQIDLPDGYKPSQKEEYMSPRQLQFFRNKLSSWRADLVEESRQTIESLRDEVRDVGDEAERATRETENSLELRTRDRYRKLIAKIDKALKRIEEGRYGFCEETDEEIGIDRLEARPIATLSLDAQERWEHRQKQMGD
jgi:DnaK suppressor protein